LDSTKTAAARFFSGVDVSKDRMDVCLRWSEPERHDKGEAGVVVSDDAGGIDALASCLLEERTVLVILEATGGFERTMFCRLGLASDEPCGKRGHLIPKMSCQRG